MAITVGNTQTATNTSTSLAINKPTSLAVGDFMVAFVKGTKTGIDGNGTWSAEAGWAADEQVNYQDVPGNSSGSAAMFTKVADADDVAASNFTFSRSVATNNTGTVTRLTGHRPNSTVAVSNSSSNTNVTSSPVSLAIGGTPAVADSLLMIFVGAQTSATSNYANYAIATSNPTWTEVLDTNDIALAYASRPETTATGNISYTLTVTEADILTIFAIISPAFGATVPLDVATIAASAPDPTITGGMTATLDVASIVSSAIDFLFAGQAKWSAKVKSSTSSFTNPTKARITIYE